MGDDSLRWPGLNPKVKVRVLHGPPGSRRASWSAPPTARSSPPSPHGATSGKIVVTTPGGIATSASSFTVTLSITGFTPTNGPAGTEVTITGLGFTSTAGVKFNGVAASSVTYVSPTQLKAKVASTATTGRISVTTAAGTVSSAATFTKT